MKSVIGLKITWQATADSQGPWPWCNADELILSNNGLWTRRKPGSIPDHQALTDRRRLLCFHKNYNLISRHVFSDDEIGSFGFMQAGISFRASVIIQPAAAFKNRMMRTERLPAQFLGRLAELR